MGGGFMIRVEELDEFNRKFGDLYEVMARSELLAITGPLMESVQPGLGWKVYDELLKREQSLVVRLGDSVESK